MTALQKLWKMFFISSKKLFSFSKYSSFCISVLPSSFPVGKETLSIDKILNKEHFYRNHAENVHQKLVPDPINLQVMKQVKKNSFISYVLSDQVWWCNIKRFLSYSKNCICKFMQANSSCHKLFHFNLFFWIWKVWRDKITKIWISREQKELFR